MAVLYAKKLMQRAQDGERLTGDERRHVIAWLDVIGEHDDKGTLPKTNAELAELFSVTERTITNDRSTLREEVAKNIKTEDIALILADIRMSYERTIRDIQKSKAKCSLGTKTYLDHCNAEFKLQMDFVRGFQDLGVYPKELGTLHVDQFNFSATVGLEAAGRPVNYLDEQKGRVPVIEGQIMKALPDGQSSESTTEDASDADHSDADAGQACTVEPPTGT